MDAHEIFSDFWKPHFYHIFMAFHLMWINVNIEWKCAFANPLIVDVIIYDIIYTLNQIKVHKHTDFNRVFTSTSTSFFFHLNARSFMFISNANSPICRSLIWCPKLHSHLFTNYIYFFNVNKHAIDVRARAVPKKMNKEEVRFHLYQSQK